MFGLVEFIQKLFHLFLAREPGPEIFLSFFLIFLKLMFYHLINQFMVKRLKFHAKNEKKYFSIVILSFYLILLISCVCISLKNLS